MEISRYIQSLLRVRDSVILGGFGIFVSEEVSAQLNPNTKEIIPPHKEIKFDGTVTRDSGVLIQYVAKKEKISKEEAEEKINKYVQKLKETLDGNQTANLEGLGSFSKGKKGYEFTFIPDDNLLLEAYGLEKVNYKSEFTKSKERQPVQKAKKNTPQKTQKNKVRKAAPVRPKKRVEKTQAQEKPRKKRVWLAVLIPLLLIGILFLALYLFKPEYWNAGKSKIAGLFGSEDSYEIIEPGSDANENSDNNPQEEDSEEDYTMIETDTAATNEADSSAGLAENMQEDIPENTMPESETIKPEEKPQEVVQTSTGNLSEDFSSAQKGKCYIVVASVKYKKSAKSEKQRFNELGIPVSIVFAPSINRYRISAGEFTNMPEARKKLAELQSKQPDLDGWVWEKK